MSEQVVPKTVLRALEKVFAAEINNRLPFQSKANLYRDSLASGLVESMQLKFGNGIMGCVVSGYALTHRGRILYCESCREKEHA